MIRIDDKINDIDKIAEQHYTKLKSFLIHRMETYVDEDGTFNENLGSLSRTNTIEAISFLKTNLKKIITCKPSELLKLHNKFMKKIKRISLGKLNNPSSIANNLLNIFDYNKFIEKDEKAINIHFGKRKQKKEYYSAYHLAEQLNISVCPYCNRQYTTTVIADKNKYITRPEFDHFFDKASYPMLALSFYNLIPSCHICNSTLKHSKPFSLNTHIHPYSDGFGDNGVFIYDVDSCDDLFKGRANSNSIISFYVPKSPIHDKIKNNVDVFQLEPVYNQAHKDLLLELIRNSELYSPDYISSIIKLLKDNGRNIDEAQIYNILYSNYINEKEFHKRTLSKFTRDILTQLGIINLIEKCTKAI